MKLKIHNWIMWPLTLESICVNITWDTCQPKSTIAGWPITRLSQVFTTIKSLLNDNNLWLLQGKAHDLATLVILLVKPKHKLWWKINCKYTKFFKSWLILNDYLKEILLRFLLSFYVVPYPITYISYLFTIDLYKWCDDPNIL